MRPRRWWIGVLGAGLISAITGCGTEAPSVDPGQVLRDPRRHLVEIVAGPSADPRNNFTLVMSGRVTASGKHVVLVDMRAPYVRVYRRSGQLRSAFLKDGRGPLEARSVRAVAVAGDSLILVADVDGRVRTFDLDGGLRQNLPRFPFGVVSATTACPGEWLLYGARFSPGGTSARWLHRLPIGAGPEALTSVFGETVGSAEPRSAMSSGLIATPRGAALWHTLGDRPSLVTWRCGASSAASAPLADGVRPPPGATEVRGAMVTTVGPGTRMRGGLAAARGRLWKTELVTAGTKALEYSEITAADQHVGRAARLSGYVVLLDSRPGVGVLVQVYEGDEQRVLLLSERDFLALAQERTDRP
ncbi:hypothetical protein [Longimicrobium terrae]|uniref:6-bladed beta-propeller n=1 Tax=Longimicrobium terrae TaxID=1639882 RepID=A0A841H276_9BACT|nr:hypothetical protein [Longimicrobium terrae]MBB4637944.1 hypothetical protein [Longimicrobium terrae]MBB6072191.1 hypothetical protein [Longimicrobium terrae]NNC28383.1 hypothetical protein [Longimicrobium terrae]